MEKHYGVFHYGVFQGQARKLKHRSTDLAHDVQKIVVGCENIALQVKLNHCLHAIK